MSFSRTQHSASGESRTSDPSIPSIALYHWTTGPLHSSHSKLVKTGCKPPNKHSDKQMYVSFSVSVSIIPLPIMAYELSIKFDYGKMF